MASQGSNTMCTFVADNQSWIFIGVERWTTFSDSTSWQVQSYFIASRCIKMLHRAASSSVADWNFFGAGEVVL